MFEDELDFALGFADATSPSPATACGCSNATSTARRPSEAILAHTCDRGREMIGLFTSVSVNRGRANR